MSPAALSWELAWHVQSPTEVEPVLVVVAPVGHPVHPAFETTALYWCSGHAMQFSPTRVYPAAQAQAVPSALASSPLFGHRTGDTVRSSVASSATLVVWLGRKSRPDRT